MDYCKKYIKVAWVKTGPKAALFSRLRCKQWNCDYCAKKNASVWRAHLLKRLPEVSQEWWLLTLTANEEARSATESLANVRKGIDTLFKRAKRVWNGIEYVRVYERHPTSVAIHAHLIVCNLTAFVVFTKNSKNKLIAAGANERKGYRGTWAVKTWWKKNSRECKMGYIVDVRRIEGDPARAVGYVLKYATKALQDLHEPYLRHIQATTGIGGPQNEKHEGWITGSYITADTFEWGTRVIDLNTGEVIDQNFWEGRMSGIYPNED
jgi:hypothetical protein